MLRVEHVSVSYGPHRALDDVSVRVEPGEIVVILGANGAGKSTLLKAIAGLIKAPGAAVTIEDAELLARLTAGNRRATVKLHMSAEMYPDTESKNVILEIRGREHPEEVVVMGAHIDSWDVGQGAQDDAAGVVAAWHALRSIKTLGLTPRRTLRVVLWTSEENGGAGAEAYAEAAKRSAHLQNIYNVTKMALEQGQYRTAR